jgi:hypothetical protein
LDWKYITSSMSNYTTLYNQFFVPKSIRYKFILMNEYFKETKIYLQFHISLFLSFSNPSVTFFFFSFLAEGWFRVNFDTKITPPLFFLLSWLNKWFHIFSVFFRLFLWFRHLCTTLFVLISRLCAVCFWFSVLVRCLFDPGWKFSFEQVQIWSMTLASSTLQIRRHEYFGDLNIL